MRSPWASFVAGAAGLIMFGPFAMLWVLPMTGGPIIIDTPSAFLIPGALGVALSVFGIIVAARQMRASMQPRWPAVTGLALGILNACIWGGSVGFIVLKMLSLYVHVY